MTHRCRECGCYDYVHGGRLHHEFRRANRIQLWVLDHDTVWAHVKAWSWLNLRTRRSRWRYIERLSRRHTDLCWCDLVDCWWRAEPAMRSDYRAPHGCVCDFPMPRRVKPSAGDCYCTPPDSSTP